MKTNTIPKLNRLQKLPALTPKKKNISVSSMIHLGAKLIANGKELYLTCDNDPKIQYKSIKAVFEAHNITERVNNGDLMSVEEYRVICKKYKLKKG